MGRPHRQFDPDFIYHVQNFCHDGKALMLPTEEITAIIVGLLLKWAVLLNIRIIAFIFLPHRFDRMLKAPSNNLNLFMCYFQRDVLIGCSRLLRSVIDRGGRGRKMRRAVTYLCRLCDARAFGASRSLIGRRRDDTRGDEKIAKSATCTVPGLVQRPGRGENRGAGVDRKLQYGFRKTALKERRAPGATRGPPALRRQRQAGPIRCVDVDIYHAIR